MGLSLADELLAARQMVVALTANQTQVAQRGADAEFVADGQAQIAQLELLDTEQEALKAALKIKTTEVKTAHSDLHLWLSEAIKIVKLAYQDQQEKWIEFGIKATR